MVSTRHHPRPFPEPSTPTSPTRSTTVSPSKSPPPTTSSPRTKTSSVISNATEALDSAISRVKPAAAPTIRAPPRKRKSTTTNTLKSYTHALDPLTILWLLFSLPLVCWDTAYVLLRPATMPGGSLHLPIWKLYNLYGTVDYMYGWPAWNDGVGFTAAQGSLNALETAMYLYYLVTVIRLGKGDGVLEVYKREFWTTTKMVGGDGMAGALVVCFAAAVMTVGKTLLYWLNEYFSNFENVGHNSWSTLFWLWILPNGLWIVFPAYVAVMQFKEIVGALHLAGGSGKEE